DGVMEVGAESFDGDEDGGEAVGVMLKISEHFGEGDGPLLQLHVVFDGNAEHFGGDDGGEGLGEFGEEVDFSVAAGLDIVDEPGGDFLDVVVEFADLDGHEGGPGELAEAGVGGGVAEKHLLDHDLGDGADFGGAQGFEVFGRGGALGGELGEDGDDVFVAGDDPGVEVGVPVN